MPYPYEQRNEVGPWFEVGKRLDSTAAQLCLTEGYTSNGNQQRPYCIYVHVPFCTSRCSYCALYTRAVMENQDKVFDEYLFFVKQAITTHPNYKPSQSPVTVHFGGGTPLTIGLDRFAELVTTLRGAFGDSSECEWAVETTTSSINSETISVLSNLGMDRIHLGIQTLDNDIRRQIRRRASGEVAVEKIEQLHTHGFHTSVDLIVGFENQTEQIILADLERLYSAGIRMFSICELRNLNINKDDIREVERMAEKNYFFWQLIWKFMEEHKLIPVHLGQFGRSYEDNLYFTHPARGEDCVAIGPYAHGTLARMYYSNKLLPHYYNALRQNAPPIDFAVVYDDSVQKIRNLESQLLAHRIGQGAIDDLLNLYSDKFQSILNFWLENELLLSADNGDSFLCSREGSWFVGNMILQARQLVNHN